MSPLSPHLLGRIHFVGKDMSGNLTIGLDREQLKRSLPIATDHQADLEDWVRELANQLMGLVKTRLQQHGVNVILSLPLTVKPSMPRSSLTSRKPGSKNVSAMYVARRGSPGHSTWGA